MRRSQLEMYVSILQALCYYGPLKLTRITYKANLNCSQLKGCLDLLIEKGLVEERAFGKNRIVYAATPRSKTILAYFDELKEFLPVAEDYRNF